MLLEGYAVMKEESTLIWVSNEMPLNMSGDRERCIEALTLFTCFMRFGEHWGRNRVSAPEGTSVEGAGVRFARRCSGREFLFFGLGSTADERLHGGRRR